MLPITTELIAVIFVFFYVLAIGSAVEAILKARTAQGAIAWVVSLLTLPYVTVPLYLVLGRNRFDGYLRERRHIEKLAEERLKSTRSGLLDFTATDTEKDFYRSLHRLARFPTIRGNAAQLLIDGQTTFDSIEEGLREAQRYILFQFYIVRDDDLGGRLGAVLAERAEAGVRVYVLYDEIGSRGFARSALHRRLSAAGVELAAFNTTQGRRNRFQLNFRNHRKVVVVDGHSAWIGGHNVGDEYLGNNPRRGPWRDTHLRLRGPVVLGAELTFAADWLWASRELISIDLRVDREPVGPSSVLLFPSDPASAFEEAGLMYHQVITQARERIWIASPYFVPDRGIIAALQLAALRGVDVRVMIPDQSRGPWWVWPTGPLRGN